MNSFKPLLVNIRRCAAENIPKLALTIMIVGLISYSVLGAALAPLGGVLASGAVNPIVFIAAFFLLFAVAILNNILLYGFFIMVHLMYKKERAVLGHLFTGFRDFLRAFKTALFLITIHLFVSVTASLGLFFADFFTTAFFTKHIDICFTAVVSLSLCVLAFLYLHFAFVWFLLYENPKLKVMQALRKSSALMKKKRFTFFLLCVQSGGFYLAFALVSLIVPPLLGQKIGTFSAFTLSFIRVLSTLFLYISLIRIGIAFAAAYEAVKSEQNAESSGIQSACNALSAPADTQDDSAHTNSGDTDL